MTTDWTGLATLVAAVAAAVLSAASLLLAGRREDKRWKREVLRETMVSLFDASFGYIDEAAFNAQRDGRDVRWYKERALDAHAAQLEALTRLRFLANSKVLDCAFNLHDVEDQLFDLVFKDRDDQPDWVKLKNDWSKLHDERRKARSELFNASRRNLGLWRTLPVGQTKGLGPSTEEMALHAMKRQRREPEPDQRRTRASRRQAIRS
jgi:hypothetical protein